MNNVPSRNSLISSDIFMLVTEWKIAGRPRQGGIDWKLKDWLIAFPEHEASLTELKKMNFGLLDRKFVRSVVQAFLKNNQLELAFLVTLIWGYGDRGYGRFRAKELLRQKKLSESLKDCTSALNTNDTNRAFKSLIETGADGLGSSFGTKFLYFAAKDDVSPRPIILDRLVLDAIQKWGVYPRKKFITIDSEKYLKMTREFHEAAIFYKIESDELEEILFSRVLKDGNSGSWSVEPRGNSSQQTKMAWAVLLVSNLIRKGASVNIKRSHGGGGQYDSVEICINRRPKIEIDMNVHGSVHIHNNETVHLSWQTVFEMGIHKVTNRLMGFEDQPERSMPNNPTFSYSWLARALIGESELTVDSFDTIHILPDNEVERLEKLLGSMNNANLSNSPSVLPIENTFILLHNNQIVGLLDPKNAVVIKVNGELFRIEADSYMPVENYYDEL